MRIYHSAVKDATVSFKINKSLKAKLVSLSKTEFLESKSGDDFQ